MPAAIAIIETEEEQRDPNSPPTAVEHVKLWVPSDMAEVDSVNVGTELARMEERVREAQCREALRALRRKLYAKSHLIHFRNTHVTGQRDSGRARGQIEELGIKIELVAEKYRHARNALLKLRSGEGCDRYLELKDQDIMLYEEQHVDGVALEKLGRIGSERSRVHAAASRERKKTLSWIWTSLGGPDADEEREIHDGMFGC